MNRLYNLSRYGTVAFILVICLINPVALLLMPLAISMNEKAIKYYKRFENE